MIKYYCDFCKQEVDKSELRQYIIPVPVQTTVIENHVLTVQPRGDIGSQKLMLCKECSWKLFNHMEKEK